LAAPAGNRLPAPTGVRTVDVVHDILLVEDNPDARETLRLLLELEGHRVAAAETGEEGIELVRQRMFTVGLIDIGLPDVDGYHVARSIRAIPSAAKMVLVALTGYSEPEDVRRAHEAGFNAHLVKPVDPDTLTKSIADLT
jgi:CheY-like chemotaxis protein